MRLNIYQKLMELKDAVPAMGKSKEAFGYSYVPESEILTSINGKLRELNLLLYPRIVPGTLKLSPFTYKKYKYNRDTKSNDVTEVSEIIASADAEFVFVNTEDPSETLIVPWLIVGMQADASMAFGGALTYCNRYFLLKFLEIPTDNDDPDEIHTRQLEKLEAANKRISEEEKARVLKESRAALIDLCSSISVRENGAHREEVLQIIAKHNGGKKDPRKFESPDAILSCKLELEAKFMKEEKEEDVE